jgi:DNA (cytosine-5)-methyltransferase 1
MNSQILNEKLARIRAGKRPRVLDLFAGCGGLSLGFEAAGFEIKAAVEFDPDAARSHGLNFHGGDPVHSEPVDITSTPPETFAARLGLQSLAREFDVVIGGPPCQAFARGGPAKVTRDR